MKASLPSPRILASRILWRWSGSGSTSTRHNPVAARIVHIRIFDSLLSEKIMSYKFSKKFEIPNFECYTGVTDPVQHLRTYEVKMVVHSHNDYLICRVFPFSLKGITLG